MNRIITGSVRGSARSNCWCQYVRKGWSFLFCATFTTAIYAVQPANEFATLSLDELADVEITSVSKSAEPLRRAAAPIYVITRDDILRAGARTVPEMLRLAPNLQIQQTTSSSYAISSRGFSGNPNAQNFTNKLLVLIDGRSVYSPLFSGIYWDMQDVLPEDIERIEVISGPGATMWGANAVNGVINIITRPATETQGGLLTANAGNLERGGAVRYGSEYGDSAVRVYAKATHFAPSYVTPGDDADDDWSRAQGGFRADWSVDRDRLMVQGALYRAIEQQSSPGDLTASGGHLLARWQRSLSAGGSLQLQTYADQVQRYDTVDNNGFVVKTYDVELQHDWPALGMHSVIWGAGYRNSRYDITPRLSPISSLIFDPHAGTLDLVNVFAEDTMALAQNLKFTLGGKFEKATGADFAFMPSARLAWSFDPYSTLWTSASRAVRSSTPFDRDVVEKLGPIVFLTGDKNYENETVTAYQMGYRVQAWHNVSWSITVFKNIYDNLRSIEFSSTGIPLLWGNAMEGSTMGAEIWASYQALPNWRLSAGWNGLRKNLRFENGSSGLLGVSQAGNDPSSQTMLRSSLDITPALTFDATLRGVRELPQPEVAGYVELNARLGYTVTPRFAVALVGENLLQASHREFTDGDWIRRGVSAQAQWKF